jgi:hypothetical protein
MTTEVMLNFIDPPKLQRSERSRKLGGLFGTR